MALNPKFSTGFRNALIDGGDVTNLFSGGEMHIYSGAQPADADTTEGAGTKLATIVLPTPAFAASAVGGSIAKAATDWATTVAVSGTATWFRIYDSAVTLGASTTAVRMDGTVATATADLVLNTVALTTPDPLSVDTFALNINA
jgi:hypothetical protein